MSNCRDNPVLYKFGREGRDACWSSFTVSLNNFANRQRSELCLPPSQRSSRSACDSSKYNYKKNCVANEPRCRTELYLPSPRLSSKSACDSSKYEYKRSCMVNEPVKCKSVSRGASPNCSPAVSNGGSVSNDVSASNGGGTASKRKSDPIKTPPQPQAQKKVPPPLERRLTARRFRSASTPRRPMDVQSPDRAPEEAQPPPAVSCSSEVPSTPRASRGSRQDMSLVSSQALFSESECHDAKKNGLAAVPPAEPPADSAVEPTTVQLATEVEVTSSPATVSNSLRECKSSVKTSVVNPYVIVTAVDEKVNYKDKKVATVDEMVTAVDVMKKTAVEEKSVTAVDHKVSTEDKTEISMGVMMTAALDDTTKEVLNVPDEILTSLNETLVAAEATISATEGTVATAVKEKVTVTEEIVTDEGDGPKFTKSLVTLTASPSPLCLGGDYDIKSSEVLVVPNKEESLVLDEYKMKIKKIDENIVSYSKSFIGAVLLFVMYRVLF